MEKLEKKRSEATRKLNRILEIQRKIDETYVGWPSTNDINNYQRIMSSVIEISEYLGDKDNDDIKRCKKVLSVIKRMHTLSLDKKYTLYREITDLLDIFQKDIKVVITNQAEKCTENLKEFI